MARNLETKYITLHDQAELQICLNEAVEVEGLSWIMQMP